MAILKPQNSLIEYGPEYGLGGTVSVMRDYSNDQLQIEYQLEDGTQFRKILQGIDFYEACGHLNINDQDVRIQKEDGYCETVRAGTFKIPMDFGV